jgi:geranylgeranyl diphosphate synthase type I
VSLELFHIFCLIHDDIIDNGTERHGMPTAQCRVAALLREEGRTQDAERIGQAQALLLGDMLFAWAQEAFHANRDFDDSTRGAAARYFGRMIDEVVIGEMLDVDMTSSPTTTFSAIQQKMLLKTASYTFIRPLQIGAALAGRGTQAEKFCHDFGLAVGVAFQIQDDLLDIVGTPETTHKTLFADLREAQHTYFTQFIFENGTPAQQLELRGLMGADLGPQDRPRVLELFESSGALAKGRSDITWHFDHAQALLEKSPVPRAHRGSFENLLATLQNRPS